METTSRGPVHLGQRVCKVEVWEINLGGLFGVALGKGLCHGVREFGRSLTRVQEGGQCWGLVGTTTHREENQEEQ